ERPAGAAHALLALGQRRLGDAPETGQRHRGNGLETGDAGDLLDEIGGAVNIRPPGWRRHLYLWAAALDLEAEVIEGSLDGGVVEFQSGYFLDAAHVEVDDVGSDRRFTGDELLRRLAAGDLDHHCGRQIETRFD